MVVIIASIFVRLSFSSYEIKNYPTQSNGPIVAYGDSLIEGVGASKTGGFVALLSEKIDEDIVNLGVSGDTTRDGVERINDVLEQNPRLVFVLLGGNDFIKKIAKEETFSNLRTIVGTIQAEGAVVVLLGVRGGIVRDGYDSNFKDLARETGSVYVPNVLGGVFGNPELMSDVIHPNQAGYQFIADKVYVETEKLKLF